MVLCEEQVWKEILLFVEEMGVDGIELNFGCLYGMVEWGMGLVVGQVFEYIQMVMEWCKKYYFKFVIVKLIFNIIDVCFLVWVVNVGGVDVVSFINMINLIMLVDLDMMVLQLMIGGKGIYGGYCGLVVKFIVMNMVVEIVCDFEICGLLIFGIGGVIMWCDVVEFMVLGVGNVQVCIVVMIYGFKVV